MSNARHTLLEEVAQLEAHAQNQLNGRVRNLRLAVRDNGLILQGQAHTYYAKQLAQHVVMERAYSQKGAIRNAWQ
jgi:hypothetical protein